MQRPSHYKTSTPEPTDEAEEEEERHYTGPLATADYLRMKEELDKLRKVCAVCQLNGRTYADSSVIIALLCRQ